LFFGQKQVELSSMSVLDEFQKDKELEELHLKEAEELAQLLSKRYGVPYIDLSKTSINADALHLIPEEEARALEVATFQAIGKEVSLAALSPQKPEIQDLVENFKLKNLNIKLFITTQDSLEHAWERYADLAQSEKTKIGLIEISDQNIAELTQKFKTLEDIQKEIGTESAQALKEGGISGILEVLLAGALVTEASDIHIEPEEGGIRLRYRLDGVLQDVSSLEQRIYVQVLSRIKLVSGMKLNIKQAAQDGRFSIRQGEAEIEIRSSIIPSAYGESIVMRILNPKTINLTFETLGVEDKLFHIFDQEIHKPNGLVLLTGPTGSGKTTTLYSFLRRINSPETKIITIEDPIEYHLKGINQTQVNRKEGYTFLSGLRSALRQDPDIIMVGEIRDSETAKVAIHSSLTGHLVFSTLHTNNAAGTIPRLIDLGINPKIITSALTLSIAQRLVRKLCEVCKEEYEPGPGEKEVITPILESIKKKRPDLLPASWTKLYKGKGCKECNGTGYKGRLGIYEAIVMDDQVAKATIENPNEKEIQIAATSQGILDMRQDGILKIVNGKTTLDELGRVVDLYEEII